MNVRYEIFESLGFPISVKLVDNSQKDTILLLHGFNDTKESFIFLEEFLNQRFNIVSFDYRGHGDSGWKKDGLYHYNENIIDLHGVVNVYLPETFFILGHSLGAALGARYTGIFPEKIEALICLEGFSGIKPMNVERENIIKWLGRTSSHRNSKFKTMSSLEEASNVLSMVHPRLNPEKVDKLVRTLVKQVEDGKYIWKSDPRTKLGFPMPFSPGLSRELWRNILCPVMICFGEETHLKAANLQEVLSHFKNLKYIEIENAGHNIHHDNPEKLIACLDEFLTYNQLV
ncbi:MAG: alpha/beta hydrolase [Leptospiraceae bacterium]|nr:alpha/beta hydrolase [Leptospiraceae bacterium]MCP5495325.1 alpha/beta hydrolase [Leptospiraceae bacterium]